MKASIKAAIISGVVFTGSAVIATNGQPNGPATWVCYGSAACFVVSLLWAASDK